MHAFSLYYWSESGTNATNHNIGSNVWLKNIDILFLGEYKVHTTFVFTHVNIKGYTNVKKAELYFTEDMGNTEVQSTLYFMPTAGNEDDFSYARFVSEKKRWDAIWEDSKLQSQEILIKTNGRIDITAIVRNGLYQEAGIVQHFVFILTFSSTSGVVYDKQNLQLHLSTNIKGRNIHKTLFINVSPLCITAQNMPQYGFPLTRTLRKSVHIRSFFSPYFRVFELNLERYGVSLRIQSECGKIRTRKTPNTDTFHSGILTYFRSVSKKNPRNTFLSCF